jgi:uncharacterized protein
MDFDELPASWPPEDLTRVMPIFPLSNLWLFPGAILPLNIFEPRYRQMIEDCLDGPGRFVLGTIKAGFEDQADGPPPFHEIAGFGEIGRHDRQEDGRYHILLIGLGRVRVEEVESDRLYRKVTAQALFELDEHPADEVELRTRLTLAIQRRTAAAHPGQPLPEIPTDVPIGRLADLLALRMPLPHDVICELFSQMDVATRARRALEEDVVRPLLPPQAPPTP